MKTNITINGKDVEITLTKDQVSAINRASMNIMDRVKTFEDALELAPPSENVRKILDYNGIDRQMLSTQAHAKISIIAKALNEGWEPDWTDDTWKYWPWFRFTPGVGFSFDVYGSGSTSSSVGSRLCFKSRALAEYAGKQFQDLYNDFLS